MRTRLKKQLGPFAFGLGIVLQILFYLIGSDVNENGVLHEPFVLLPVSFILMFTGIVMIMTSISPLRVLSDKRAQASVFS